MKGPRETPTVRRWVPSCGTSPSGSHPGSAPPPVLQARPCPGVEQLHDSLPRIHSIPLGGRKAVAFTVKLYESEPDIKPDDIYIATSIGEELYGSSSHPPVDYGSRDYGSHRVPTPPVGPFSLPKLAARSRASKRPRGA